MRPAMIIKHQPKDPTNSTSWHRHAGNIIAVVCVVCVHFLNWTNSCVIWHLHIILMILHLLLCQTGGVFRIGNRETRRLRHVIWWGLRRKFLNMCVTAFGTGGLHRKNDNSNIRDIHKISLIHSVHVVSRVSIYKRKVQVCLPRI